MAPKAKAAAAVGVARREVVDAESVQEPTVPRSAAIGDVLSMKGLLDDYVLLLLEEQYGARRRFLSCLNERSHPRSRLQT